jgi:hypothetical protein
MLSIISPHYMSFINDRYISYCIVLPLKLSTFCIKDFLAVMHVFVKIHIQKAFYTLDWNFLDRVLHGFGNNELCAWIQTILHPAKLFIWVNGKVVGFFNCMREVRYEVIIFLLLTVVYLKNPQQ